MVERATSMRSGQFPPRDKSRREIAEDESWDDETIKAKWKERSLPEYIFRGSTVMICLLVVHFITGVIALSWLTAVTSLVLLVLALYCLTRPYHLCVYLPMILGFCGMVIILSTCAVQGNGPFFPMQREFCGPLWSDASDPVLSMMYVLWVLMLTPKFTPTPRLTIVTIGILVVPTVINLWLWIEEPVPLIFGLVLLIASGWFYKRKSYLDKSLFHKFAYVEKRQILGEQLFSLLRSMMPSHVLPPLILNPSGIFAQPIRRASVMFVSLESFENVIQRYPEEPEKVLEYLNYHFTRFDTLCARHGVTKIETLNHEYVCAVGVTPTDEEEDKAHGHTEVLMRLINCALSMLQMAEQSQEEPQEEPLQIKMGIATGPIISGVVGKKLPRFRLFGKRTINVAIHMMQKGVTGQVQFGEETKRLLPDGVRTRALGTLKMKEKTISTYLLQRERASTVSAETGALAVMEEASQVSKMSLTQRIIQESATGMRRISGPKTQPQNDQKESATWMRRISGPKTQPQNDQKEGTGRWLQNITLGGAAGRAVDVEMSSEMVNLSNTPSLHLARTPLAKTSRRQHDIAAMSVSVDGDDRMVPFPTGTTFQTDKDPHFSVKHQFRQVLEKVADTTDKEIKRRRGYRGISCYPLPLNWSWDFQDEFIGWFHEQSVIKKLENRLGKQEFGMSALTVFDLWWAVFFSDGILWNEHPFFSLYRLQAFLAFRLIVFATLTYWRAVAVDDGWIRMEPRRVQRYIILTYMLLCTALYASYGALVRRDDQDAKGPQHGLLIFALVSHGMIMQLPQLAFHSIWFIGFSFALMFADTFFSFSGDSTIFPTSSVGAKITFVMMSFTTAYNSLEEEIRFRERWVTKKQMEDMQERIESILDTMMPVGVVEEMRNLEMSTFAPEDIRRMPSHRYDDATIVQGDLCGFSQLSNTRRPQDVVKVLSEIFGLFDDITDAFDIYKVETVGDTYIAGQAGAPLTQTNSPLDCVRCALEMIRKTHEWSRKKGEKISCAIGMHHGTVIGGIVGTEMQRYHLFGKLMHVVSVLEDTAPPGKVQMSEACKNAVERDCKDQQVLMQDTGIYLERRSGDLPCTQDGMAHTYDDVQGPTYLVNSYGRSRGQFMKEQRSSSSASSSLQQKVLDMKPRKTLLTQQDVQRVAAMLQAGQEVQSMRSSASQEPRMSDGGSRASSRPNDGSPRQE